MSDVAALQTALGVEFGDRRLLELALVHGSYLNENPGSPEESNERLEFLGDAVIGMAAAHELYRRNPEWPEGLLSEARSELVREETLARVASRLELGGHLRMGRGAASGGGRRRPSVLASALEAVVGAVSLDQGYAAAEAVVVRLLAPEMARLERPSASRNPKSALQEALQAEGAAPPTYSIVDVSGKDHCARVHRRGMRRRPCARLRHGPAKVHRGAPRGGGGARGDVRAPLTHHRSAPCFNRLA